MVLHRPSTYGSSFRDLRRALVVISAIVVIVFAACAPAWAGEPEPQGDHTALARVAIAESRLDDARRVLGRVKAAATSDGERAAADEMTTVVERWMALKRVIFPRWLGRARGEREAGGEPSRGTSSDVPVASEWENGFAIARAQLMVGDFDLAAPNFAALQSAARDEPARLRARALGSLARELATKGLVLGWTEPEARPASEREVPQKRRWYGWQTLIADGVSVLVVPVVGSMIDSGGHGGDRVALAAVGSYLLAPGVIHLAHGRVGAAAGSVGLRIGMPLTGALVGMAVSKGNCHSDFCGLSGAAVGFVVGAIGASTIDAAVLARETVDDDAKPAAATAPHKAIAITPTGGPRREGGFDVGVGAVF